VTDERRDYDAPGAGASQRCAWCGLVSARTRGPRAVLVPMPAGFREWALGLETILHKRVLFDEYGAAAGVRSRWWCRGQRACAGRRGGTPYLEGS
jgi:hypothetical protein